MFNIKFDITIRLDGCPDSGLDCIDWRRANGLPDDTTPYVRLRWHGIDEALVRRYSSLADPNGDLVIRTHDTGDYVWTGTCNRVRQLLSTDPYADSASSLYHSRVSADLARPTASDAVSAKDVAAVIDSLLAQAAAQRQEKDACRAAREEADRAAREEADREKAIKQLAQAAQAAAEAEKKAAARKAALQEAKSWAAVHGSDRLRRCLAEDIECTAIYLDERLAVERPGWRWYNSVPWIFDNDGPRNPPMAALDLLDEARHVDPDCRLEYVEYTPDEDDDCPDEDDGCPDEDDGCETKTVRGYCCYGEFLGRGIVYTESNSPLN